MLDHDFPIPENGKGVPYGIYDITENVGFVNLGRSSDTAEFAVESLRRWWWHYGHEAYPDAAELVVLRDGGGSNSSRSIIYKKELVELSDEIGIPVKVRHYPPGTSKWNMIEHRLFSYISKNWAGRPLDSIDTMIKYIKSTTTEAGLRVDAMLDKKTYQTGRAATQEDKDYVEKHIRRDELHGQWNYTIYGNLSKAC